MDARFPLFHFPPALHSYIVHDLKKPMILVMSKQDLVDNKTIRSWKKYFKSHFPDMNVVSFNSFQTANKDGEELLLWSRKLVKTGNF